LLLFSYTRYNDFLSWSESIEYYAPKVSPVKAWLRRGRLFVLKGI
jgi:hypothetical protein